MADASGRFLSAFEDGNNRTAAALDQALGEDVAADEDFAYAIGVLARQRDEARAEVERLHDGIRRHRRAKTPKTPEARRAYGLPNFADQSLWALLDDREDTT